jgi:hypothetical protein
VAEIYGFATDEYFAKLPGVVDAVHDTAQRGGARASALLAQHHAQGHARILVERGNIPDSFVVLSDERGQRAAAAIEFGRSGGPTGAMQGIFVLRRAFG